MEQQNCDGDCSWKTAYERLISKVTDQLDLLEESVLSDEISSKTVHKILKKLIQDEQKRKTSSDSPPPQTSSQSSSCVKTESATILTTVKKEVKHNKNVKNEKQPDSDSNSDLDIEIIDIDMENSIVENLDLEDEKMEEVDDAQSQSEKKISTKRALNSDETCDASNKRNKSTHTQTDTSSSTTFHDNESEKEQQENEREEEEVLEANEQAEVEEEETQSPASDSTPGSTQSENEQNDENDENSFTPIYCPKVAASFWKMPPKSTEKEKAQKLVIHNYPQKLGEENYPDSQSLKDDGLWFLVNPNDSEFIYYKVGELSDKLKAMKRPKIWLQLQTSDFQNQQLQSFLSEFGKFVTHFTFERPLANYKEEQITGTEFKSLLFGKLYNVEYLVLNEDYIRISSDPNSSSNEPAEKGGQKQKLSHLKTIQFINRNFTMCSDLVERVLKSSPNVESIYNLPLKFISLIISLKKSRKRVQSIVKSVDMDHPDAYNSKDLFEQDLETLSESSIALEKLVVPVYFNELNGDQTAVSINYQNFLNSSRNSLKELQIEPTIDWSEFGKLENLSTLQINIYGFPPHYSSELNISYVFPKVKTLVVDHWTQKQEKEEKSTASPQKFFDKYFPRRIFAPGKSFKFVSELKLMNSFPVECMKNLSVLLPRISTFSWTCDLSKFREILALCPSLWAGLKTLTFEIDLGERRQDFEYADSALLGFPETVCEELRNGNEIENFDQLEKKPSILDLKKLERFEIEIQEPSCSDEDAETRIFSQISGFHGFAKMKQSNPKFQAQITLHSSCSSKYVQNVRKNLKPLLPSVNY